MIDETVSKNEGCIAEKNRWAISLLKKSGTILAYVIPIGLLVGLRIVLPANICDDAYITFKTAINLGEGHGMVFNIGQKAYVVTTPLWVLLLATTRFFTSDIVLAARSLGLIFEVLLLVNIVHFGRCITNNRAVGMLAAIFLCTNPVFLLTSFSGMELALYLLVIVLSFDLLAHKKYTWGMFVAALAPFVRFDGLLVCFVAFVWCMWTERRRIRYKPKGLLLGVLPFLVLLAGYFLFGIFYYGDAIPMSVQRKMTFTPAIFSKEWIEGSCEMLRQFKEVFIGQSAYWYREPTALAILFIPFLLGLVKGIKKQVAIPLLAFSLLYAGSFIIGGAKYARNFPWYFVPILPGSYLLSAWGCYGFSVTVANELNFFHRFPKHSFLVLVIGILWPVIMFSPLKRDVEHLLRRTVEREQAYAATAVWLGNYLEKDAIIAANEIGAVGFFSRPDIEILDMYGLIRKKNEFRTPFVDLVGKYQPTAIITKRVFKYTEAIEREQKGAYLWAKFRDIEIGVRADVAPFLKRHLKELSSIYKSVELKKEYY